MPPRWLTVSRSGVTGPPATLALPMPSTAPLHASSPLLRVTLSLRNCHSRWPRVTAGRWHLAGDELVLRTRRGGLGGGKGPRPLPSPQGSRRLGGDLHRPSPRKPSGCLCPWGTEVSLAGGGKAPRAWRPGTGSRQDRTAGRGPRCPLPGLRPQGREPASLGSPLGGRRADGTAPG